jgi:hypothetical protein
MTLKERLGAKWTDEQRVDNCKVPLDKRGIAAASGWLRKPTDGTVVEAAVTA